MLRVSVDELVVRLAHAAAHVHDLLAPIEEEIGDTDALRQQATGVGAQIEYERPHPRPRQRVDGMGELLLGGIAEYVEVHEPDAVAQQQRATDGAAVDLLPNERHRASVAGPLDQNLNGCPRRAA